MISACSFKVLHSCGLGDQVCYTIFIKCNLNDSTNDGDYLIFEWFALGEKTTSCRCDFNNSINHSSPYFIPYFLL